LQIAGAHVNLPLAVFSGLDTNFSIWGEIICSSDVVVAISYYIYQFLKWMNRRVQAEITLDEQGTGALSYLGLKFSWSDHFEARLLVLRK
jgi:hypothetical protein